MNWKLITPTLPVPGSDPWKISIQCNAFYECPKGPSGERLGPLVPYAAKDIQGRNLVGDAYFNFAKIEEHPLVVRFFAEILAQKIRSNLVLSSANTIIGVPDGGRSLGQEVAAATGKRFVYPAKVPRQKAAGAVKDEFDLIVKRFDLSPGETVIVVDDVHNNFYSTDETMADMAKTGAEVVGLCSALNRSPIVDAIYIPQSGPFAKMELPVLSAIRKALPEWPQDDPAVATDIVAGNLEKEVKKNWARLQALMEK